MCGTRSSCLRLAIRSQSRQSRRTVPIQRSANAFALGARNGVRMISTPSLRKTSSKARVGCVNWSCLQIGCLWVRPNLRTPQALSSAKLPGDDVIDELPIAGPESGPALAVDNERGEGAGRKLLLEPRQLSTPRNKEKRELVEARVMPDQHHRIDGLGKSLEQLQQFRFRGGIKLRLELNRGVLAERGRD